MTLKNLLMTIVAACCLWTSGCATVLTVAYPPVEETRKGDVRPGSQIGHHYVISEEKGGLLLQKEPLCVQEVQVINVKRKQLHGVIPAVIEIPFFGLGIADLVVAGTYTRATIEETDGGYVKGNQVLACGDLAFAPNEELILQFPVSLEVRRVTTDEKGMIPLNVVQSFPGGETRFNVFVKLKEGPSFVRTFEKAPPRQW